MINPYWSGVRKQFFGHRLAPLALFVIVLFCLVGVYAPFLASSKPIVVRYDGVWYFPLFRYLFFTGFYTKGIDLFFNMLIFTLPFFVGAVWLRSKKLLFLSLTVQLGLVGTLMAIKPRDPAADLSLNHARQEAVKSSKAPLSWDLELSFMTPYDKLNKVLQYKLQKQQSARFEAENKSYDDAHYKKWLDQQVREKRLSLHREGISKKDQPGTQEIEKMILEGDSKIEPPKMPTLWNRSQEWYQRKLARLEKSQDPNAQMEKQALEAQHAWMESESARITFLMMPLISYFHWEDDAGGQQSLNQIVSWGDLTRTTRKDLTAALIFGVRVSLVVGVLAVSLALLIGIPIGSLAGYYGGWFDIIVSRLLEIWESMPVFFMLLLVVAITQTKSITLIIGVIGLFGWTTFSRYIRAECFKQRGLPYVEACRAQGFSDQYIIFTHVLPNAIPPILTLLPFAVMGAITSEAALSFLGLGEEGSSSWGVLMDEGRGAFPGESYLLWPPAILLTVLLIAIALVGDALRDALDPKLHRS